MAAEDPTPDPKLERMKYWIDLAKWSIVSVVLVVATMIIDKGFRDRAAGIVEIQTYDKYVTDLIVLNKEVGPRRLLAQYFANVTASDKLRAHWVDYYNVLNQEYDIIAAHDSALALEQRVLARKATLTRADTVRFQEIQMQRKINDIQLNTPVIPLVEPEKRATDLSAASTLESKAFDLLAQNRIDAAIDAFDKADDSYNGYHQVYEIGRYLKQNKEQLAGVDSAQARKDAFAHIATTMNYGMPTVVRKHFLMKAGH